jgi:hypothetical protein
MYLPHVDDEGCFIQIAATGLVSRCCWRGWVTACLIPNLLVARSPAGTYLRRISDLPRHSFAGVESSSAKEHDLMPLLVSEALHPDAELEGSSRALR